MIKSFITFCFLLFAFCLGGQVNLVPNPSFEDTVNCTTGFIQEATGWLSFTDSPDYFNSCADVSSGFNVPNTGLGYQQAYDGVAYGGIVLYGVNTSPVREYVGIPLSSPLVIGQKYFVSFQASLADALGTNGWSNKLGAKFTTFSFAAPENDASLITNSAHIYSDSLLKDTANWVQIKGSFVADSAYQYIVIGNFFDDNNTDTLNCPSISYAFIDMVCVSTDSLTCNLPTNINTLPNQNKISVYPNPTKDILNITFPKALDFYEVLIYNPLGQIVLKEKINTSNAKLDLSSLNPSILFLKILYNNQLYHYKILKQ
jgi:hypothetical protein